jgi:hypothetical protein
MDDDTADGAVPARTPESNGTGDLVPERTDTGPPTPAAGRLRTYLRSEEPLRTVARGTLLDDPQGPAVVGVTDTRFVAVTDAGSVLTAGFDRTRSVRCHRVTLPTVRGVDARLAVALGFLAALVGFVGVLGTATSPITPALAFAAAGGSSVVTYVRYGGVAVEPESDTPEFFSQVSSSVRRRFVDGSAALDAFRAWTRERVDETRLTPWAGAGAVVVSLALVTVVENGFLASIFALTSASGVALVVFGFYHGRTFDRLAFDWRHQRAVTVALEDGTSVTIRTDTDADLDRQIATHVGEPRPAPGTDGNGPTRSSGDSRRTNWAGDPDES